MPNRKRSNYKKKNQDYSNERSSKQERDDSSNYRKGKGGKRAVFTKDIDNDISWWSRYPDTMRMAANLPYAYPTGPSIFSRTNVFLPGVMKLNTLCIPGISRDSLSPINIQMRHLVAKIVEKLGGSGNGDPTDYAEYIMSIDNIYAFISWCTRIYGLARFYAADNRFVPESVLSIEDIDVLDLKRNYPSLRAYINLWINQMETYAAPADMSLFSRHIQILGNIYTDFPEPRGQMYLYSPSHFYVLDEANGKLTATAVQGSGTGGYILVQDLIDFGNNMIAQLTASQNYSDLSARVRRAFGDKVYHINPMPEDYLVNPVYSQEVLLEIHNTVVTGELKYGTFNITQVTSGGNSDLRLTPQIEYGTAAIANANANLASDGSELCANIIDVPIPGQISPEMTMIATRGLVTTRLNSTDTAGKTVDVLSAGTEIVTGVVIGYYSTSQNLTRELTFASRYITSSSTATQAKLAALTSKFDWAPFWAHVSSNGAGKELIGDVTKVTIVSADTVELLNRVALESAFDVPRV